jgi:hypothetical protein
MRVSASGRATWPVPPRRTATSVTPKRLGSRSRRVDFAQQHALAELHLSLDAGVDQLACKALAERLLGIDHVVGPDQPQDAGVYLVVGARNDAFGAGLPKQCRADDRGLLGIVADRTQAQVALLGSGRQQCFLVGCIEAHGLRHLVGDGLHAFFFVVDRQDLDAALGERQGHRRSELSQADDDRLLGGLCHGWRGVSRRRFLRWGDET